MTRWGEYYALADTAPRETLLEALARHESETRPAGVAVDLGCGAGRDTHELLRRGWHVLAIDGEPQAIELLRAHPEAEAAVGRLETVVAPFQEASLPEADLVNASFALPFCTPEEFACTWARIVGALRRGGRFAGQLFGVNDSWAGSEGMTFHTRADVDRLLDGLDAERLEEVERDGTTVRREAKHWHVFHLVVRKP
ncbi:MAG TPA: class I SAM-dependent methyltransferase [Gaiellaceae bacterium]|nr:class I SAM-dependent methyltransferase [Gaiellaceae bacterium]